MANITEKDLAILNVIDKKIDSIRETIKKSDSDYIKTWNEGRIMGLMDAITLMGKSIDELVEVL